jgi:hypothetical protein
MGVIAGSAREAIPGGRTRRFEATRAMSYTILIYETPTDFEDRDTPAEDRKAAYWAAFGAYVKALEEAGVMVGGGALMPPGTGTTVRLRDDRRQVQDGPYADTKEQLGGYVVIDVPDLDAALSWASRCPAAATGAVEVRPNLPMSRR